MYVNTEYLSSLSDHELNRMLLAEFGLNPDFAIIPKYTTDLNATRLAEEWLDAKQRVHYSGFLHAVCGNMKVDHTWGIIHATAKQRTMAMILTLYLLHDKIDQRSKGVHPVSQR